ncbi:hypothetical protein BC830DRAFT_1154260 [Chytriomyces sp. MP71]|nr:hypothetical protein BC830DRAFT_1154260 [Chytriomyces sp. MP71]
MRTCVAGQVDGDPCSAKGDTLGCGVLTQGTDDYSDGFTMTDGDGAPVSFKPTTGVTAMHGTIMVPSATAQALPTTGPLSATTPLSSQTVQAMTGSVGDVMTESSISIEYGATQPLKFSTSASPTSSKYVDPVPALKSGADACAIPFLSVFLILLL